MKICKHCHKKYRYPEESTNYNSTPFMSSWTTYLCPHCGAIVGP